LLVAGTGTGRDAEAWTHVGPHLVLGVDFMDFLATWARLSSQGLRFVAARLEELPIRARSLDLVASDAVLEHCRNLDAVLVELRRVLRPGGMMYAVYGPLWYCFSGDHVSGRVGLNYGYAHLEMSPSDYDAFLMKHDPSHRLGKDGPSYIIHDLFSRLTTAQYLAAFDRAGFELVDLRLEVSAEGRRFVAKWPNRALTIVRRYGLNIDDLIIKTNFVILKRA
jgi:SAM-dependent methyltransferase